MHSVYSQNSLSKLTGLLFERLRLHTLHAHYIHTHMHTHLCYITFVLLSESHTCRLTWLKKRLDSLGLHHRGTKVNYSSVGEVQKAIEVCWN